MNQSQRRVRKQTRVFAVVESPRHLGRFLARIVQPRRNPVNRGPQRVVQVLAIVAQLLSAQKFHLDQAHRVHIGVSQPDGARQHGVLFQQSLLLLDHEQHAAGALEFLGDYFPHALP